MSLCPPTDTPQSNADTVPTVRPLTKRKKIPREVRAAVYVRDNWRCQYCGRTFSPDPSNLTGRYAPYVQEYNEETRVYDNVWLELDHTQPRKFGGADTIDNLRAACTPCNQRKSASLSASEWSIRIEAATAILAAGPPDQKTAEKAARALTGARIRIKSKSTVVIDGA